MTRKKFKTILALAKKGDKDAQYDVGLFHEDGLTIGKKQVVEPNQKKALQWFIKAYKNGSSNAAVRYADFLTAGNACDRNVKRAIKIYKAEIVNGNPIAYNNLAITYCQEKLWKKAIKLYKKIYNDFGTHSIELALCYQFGLGCKMNRKKAFKLFKLISKDNSNNRNNEFVVNEADYYLAMYYLEGKYVNMSLIKARKYLNSANNDQDHRSAIQLLNIIGR